MDGPMMDEMRRLEEKQRLELLLLRQRQLAQRLGLVGRRVKVEGFSGTVVGFEPALGQYRVAFDNNSATAMLSPELVVSILQPEAGVPPPPRQPLMPLFGAAGLQSASNLGTDLLGSGQSYGAGQASLGKEPEAQWPFQTARREEAAAGRSSAAWMSQVLDSLKVQQEQERRVMPPARSYAGKGAPHKRLREGQVSYASDSEIDHVASDEARQGRDGPSHSRSRSATSASTFFGGFGGGVTGSGGGTGGLLSASAARRHSMPPLHSVDLDLLEPLAKRVASEAATTTAPPPAAVATPPLAKEGATRSFGRGTNTKALVFRTMHACYKLTPAAGRVRSNNMSRQNAVPRYADIERALDSSTNINAARLSVLRSRALMTATMRGLEDLLPAHPGSYVVNCITSACPVCGRAIALNKLASYENWCKHLDLHGNLGRALVARFRAIDKNVAAPPEVPRQLAEQAFWNPQPARSDLAPLEQDATLVPRSLVPLTLKVSWQALALSQLLRDGALTPSSVLAQEVAAMAFVAFGAPFAAAKDLASLAGFQHRLEKQNSRAFSTYLGTPSSENKLGNHVSVIVSAPEEDGDSQVSPRSVVTEQATSPKEPGAGFGHAETKRWTGQQVPKIHAALAKWYSGDGDLARPAHTFADMEAGFGAGLDLDLPGALLPARAANACRLVILRRRNLLAATARALQGPGADEPALAGHAINAHVSSCPVCGTLVRASALELDCSAWLAHVRSCGELGAQIAQLYGELAGGSDDMEASLLASGSVNQEAQPAFAAAPTGRPDAAPLDDGTLQVDATPALLPLTLHLDWRAVALEHMLRHEVVTRTSILTQEVAVLGLFYFGLVNQRSPQKFGQYPQLQAFQRALHRESNQAYDVYCGLGLKENESGALHTRGKPITVTKSVLQRFDHYGLSHKSLKRPEKPSSSSGGSGVATTHSPRSQAARAGDLFANSVRAPNS